MKEMILCEVKNVATFDGTFTFLACTAPAIEVSVTEGSEYHMRVCRGHLDAMELAVMEDEPEW